MEEILPRLRDGGVILVDNVLWGGAVVDAARQDESTRAIRAFNDTIARDPRVEAVMIPVAAQAPRMTSGPPLTADAPAVSGGGAAPG